MVIQHSNEALLEQIEGALIVCGEITDGELSLWFQDGRRLVIAGEFAVGLILTTARFH